MTWALIVETASGPRMFGVFFDPIACGMVRDMVFNGAGICAMQLTT